jgi:DNA-binding response OmpR family regulator
METIRENVWEGKEIHYADIRMYIRKIRIKTYKDFIISSRGLGYKIEATK